MSLFRNMGLFSKLFGAMPTKMPMVKKDEKVVEPKGRSKMRIRHSRLMQIQKQIARRRAKNKMARASRKLNRGK